MDQAISAVIGAIVFIAFTGGLAESIGAIPFILIVTIVIGLVCFDTWEVIKGAIKPNGSNESSK